MLKDKLQSMVKPNIFWSSITILVVLCVCLYVFEEKEKTLRINTEQQLSGAIAAKHVLEINLAKAIHAHPSSFTVGNLTNLLTNGDFESWSDGTSAPPDGWTWAMGTQLVEQEASLVKIGKYSVKLTIYSNTAKLGFDISAAKGLTYWKGRVVTFDCWVYATQPNHAYLYIDDGVRSASSTGHPGDGQWHFLTLKYIIDSGAISMVRVGILAAWGDDSPVYFDGAMCAEG